MPILHQAFLGEPPVFREVVLSHYLEHGRHELPWRHTTDAYAILVSEVMLQQTQVSRVTPYYEAWLDSFPTPDALAAAPLEAVLELWQGLGYNRRALFLKRAAERIADRYAGVVPRDALALRALPGVGPATAAGVRVFAFGEPCVYLETNVRTVYLDHFFADREDVHDREIVPLVEATVDREDPRSWYWALLDYGAHLKRTLPNPSRRSAHHVRQSPFEGSRRQMRARILRAVVRTQGISSAELAEETGLAEDAVVEILEALAQEGFLRADDGVHRVR